MKTVEGFRMRAFAKEHIIVGESLKQVNFNKMISLNETAAYLWENIEGKDFTEEDMVKLLLDKYDVDEETATKDVKNLVSQWISAGILSE